MSKNFWDILSRNSLCFDYLSDIFPHICWVDKISYLNTIVNMTENILMGGENCENKNNDRVWSPHTIRNSKVNLRSYEILESIYGLYMKVLTAIEGKNWPVSGVGCYFDGSSLLTPPHQALTTARNFVSYAATVGNN